MEREPLQVSHRRDGKRVRPPVGHLLAEQLDMLKDRAHLPGPWLSVG